jgi:hypothetical protein
MEVEAKAEVRFMGEIVTPSHPCSTWNEKRGLSYSVSLGDPISFCRCSGSITVKRFLFQFDHNCLTDNPA